MCVSFVASCSFVSVEPSVSQQRGARARAPACASILSSGESVCGSCWFGSRLVIAVHAALLVLLRSQHARTKADLALCRSPPPPNGHISRYQCRRRAAWQVARPSAEEKIDRTTEEGIMETGGSTQQKMVYTEKKMLCNCPAESRRGTAKYAQSNRAGKTRA